MRDDNAGDNMDATSAQLHETLRAAVIDGLSTRRPILHHLSADTAWLLQIPRPYQATKRGGRLYFNILIDPWLSGTQTDITSWLSTQWHAVKPRVPSVAAVEELIREIEVLASGLRPNLNTRSPFHDAEAEDSDMPTCIDAVAISHEFTDHCHQETLLTVHADVPVFATEKAASLVRSWNHFRLVQTIPHFSGDTDWRATSIPPLPEWLGLSRLVTSADVGHIHSALLITFNSDMGSPRPLGSYAGASGRSDTKIQDELDDEAAEAVVYTPHGIHSSSEELELIVSAVPRIKTLAFLHGLEHITLGGMPLNLGAHNGLKAQRVLKAKYWVGTHDENKPGTGVVAWLLRRKKIGIKEAVEAETERRRAEPLCKLSEPATPTSRVLGSLQGVNWADLGNGESLILE